MNLGRQACMASAFTESPHWPETSLFLRKSKLALGSVRCLAAAPPPSLLLFLLWPFVFGGKCLSLSADQCFLSAVWAITSLPHCPTPSSECNGGIQQAHPPRSLTVQCIPACTCWPAPVKEPVAVSAVQTMSRVLVLTVHSVASQSHQGMECAMA